jgi:hypothetical protein
MAASLVDEYAPGLPSSERHVEVKRLDINFLAQKQANAGENTGENTGYQEDEISSTSTSLNVCEPYCSS